MKEENFGDRLKKAAALIGGQLELSKKTGISSRSINAYVMESADPAREKVVAMAKAAGVSVAWLAAGIGPMQPGQEEMEKGGQGGICHYLIPETSSSLRATCEQE